MTDLAEAKAQARALRAEMARRGQPVSHAQALEAVAHRHGARDWNGLRARLTRQGPAFHPGQRVRGRYLGQPFTGRVLSVTRAGKGQVRLAILCDRALDVVRSAAFSNLRRHLRGVVGRDGRSAEATSDGVPQLEVRADAA